MEDWITEPSELKRPGGKISARPLYFFWICDCSGSMIENGKIIQLNNAIKEALPHMVEVADENPNAEILVRAMKFSSHASWIQDHSTPVDQFEWKDLSADGETKLGQALTLLANELKMPPMIDRALKPVIVLISDGQPTDNYKQGIEALLKEPWGKKAVRIAIAIGRDAKEEVLQEFIGNSEIKPLRANNPESLTQYIQFVSTFVIKETSAPSSIIDQSEISLTQTISEAVNQIQCTPINENDIW